jgi:hypothetical protein
MSEPPESARDPRLRPADPAGTQPKVDPASLRPQTALPVRPGDDADQLPDGVVEGEAVEVDGDGGDADGGDLLPERRGARGLGAATARTAPPPHQARFHFLYGALVALGAAALAVVVIVLVTGGGRSTLDAKLAAWSAWHPSASSLAGASQIARHISERYRFDGRQLVADQASAMDFEGIPLTVAVRETAAQGGDIRFFGGSGFIYRLCGLGPSCSIDLGKPTIARKLLLHREALELALYTFRYIDSADQVVVLLPPPPGEKPSQALFFRRADVTPQLERPLDASLARRTPSVRTITVSPDAPLVDRLTGARLFSFSLTQANTANRGFLVLDPLPVITTTTAPSIAAARKKQQQKQQQKRKRAARARKRSTTQQGH